MLRLCCRCEEEDTTIADAALSLLAKMGMQTSLRYVLNLLSCAKIISKRKGTGQVAIADLRSAYEYFLDEKRSVQWMEQHTGLLVSETETTDVAPKAVKANPANSAGETERMDTS